MACSISLWAGALLKPEIFAEGLWYADFRSLSRALSMSPRIDKILDLRQFSMHGERAIANLTKRTLESQATIHDVTIFMLKKASTELIFVA